MVDMPFSHKGFPHGKTILPAHASLYTPSESYPLTSVGMHYCLGIGSEIIIRRPSIRNIPNHIYAWHANTYHECTFRRDTAPIAVIGCTRPIGVPYGAQTALIELSFLRKHGSRETDLSS